MTRLQSILTLGLRRPGACVAVTLALMAVSIGFVVLGPLEVSTSRRTLVSQRSPYQKRIFDFFSRFGRPDSAIFVVSGGSEDARHDFIDRLVKRLENIPALDDRILAKVGPKEAAEVLFLQRPDLYAALGPRADGSVNPLVAGVEALEDRIANALEGDTTGARGPEELGQLAGMLGAFNSKLRGESVHEAPGFGQKGVSESGRVDSAGYLLARAGHSNLLLLYPELKSDEGTELAPLVDAIRAARDATLKNTKDAGITADLTGMPALAVDELRTLRSGVRVTSILSAAAILALLYLAFRSLRQSLIALVPMLAGIVITLGIVEILYDGLNLVTSSFTSVLMGLGIDFGVHLMHRYGESQRHGDASPIATALIGAGPGVTTGAVTTIIAFITITTTDFDAFAQLGVITSVGLGIMMISAFALIPVLIRKLGAGARVHTRDFPGISRIVDFVGSHAWPVLMGAAALTVLAIVGFLPKGPRYNGRYFDFLPANSESYRALVQVDRDAGMGPASAYFSRDSFAGARKLTAALRALPEVALVQSATDLLPPLDAERLGLLREADAESPSPPHWAAKVDSKALATGLRDLQDTLDEVAFAMTQGNLDPAGARAASSEAAKLRKTVETLDEAGRARLADLGRSTLDVVQRATRVAHAVASSGAYTPDDLPPLFRRRFVSHDGRELAVFAFPKGDVWDASFGERFSKLMQQLDPNAAGLALNVQPHERYIIDGFGRAAAAASILIVAFLLFVFRRLSDTLLAVLPVFLAWIWTLGAMKPLGLEFTPANIVVLPLLLGIGLDAGAHMVHRAREEHQAGGITLRRLVGGTGAAVLVSSLTTMAGFGSLMVSHYGGMRGLGQVLTLGIGFSLVTSILVLPALLTALGRTRV